MPKRLGAQAGAARAEHSEAALRSAEWNYPPAIRIMCRRLVLYCKCVQIIDDYGICAGRLWYIVENPVRWPSDWENPMAVSPNHNTS